MPNTALEANLRAIGDGARLEQLAVDLLGREGYDVVQPALGVRMVGEMHFLNARENLACSISYLFVAPIRLGQYAEAGY